MNNNNFPTNSFPSPGGCGTANAPYYNTYSPAFTCPGENQGVNSIAATSLPMIFGITAPTASWSILTSTAAQYVVWGAADCDPDGACAALVEDGLPDGITLTRASTLEGNTQATAIDCIACTSLMVGNLIINPSDPDLTLLNGQQTFPSACNPCFNAPVIATCTGSCANQLTVSSVAIGRSASFTLIVPANSGAITVQLCAGCQVETPSFTSCGIPQTSQATAPVASFCPPVGRQF